MSSASSAASSARPTSPERGTPPPAPGFDCDVAIIGAGPAGATAAALLAARGWKVAAFEKDRHPRFHIGESLLPLNLPLFERLGVAEQVAAIGMVKPAAEFVSAEHGRAVSFAFADAWDKRWPHAYQVRRSELDAILAGNARARGAQLTEGCRVTQVDFAADRVVLALDEAGTRRTCTARFVIDASGRDTLLARKLNLKRRNPRHASAALYGHFEGAQRLAGDAEGNISIFWFRHGWFWFIPLRDGTTSVGAVCWPYYLKSRRTDVSAFLLDTIAMSPELSARLASARLTGPATATGNYSYVSRRMTGERHLMVGDAFAFVDPVFSSGVYLAMSGAFLAADAIDRALREPAAARAAFAGFDRQVCRGLRAFTWMIYRMTSPAMRDLFMNPDDRLGIRSAVISLLAGDVFGPGPVRRRLLAFRALYYLKSAADWRGTVAAWRRRRVAIRGTVVQATDGSG